MRKHSIILAVFLILGLRCFGADFFTETRHFAVTDWHGSEEDRVVRLIQLLPRHREEVLREIETGDDDDHISFLLMLILLSGTNDKEWTDSLVRSFDTFDERGLLNSLVSSFDLRVAWGASKPINQFVAHDNRSVQRAAERALAAAQKRAQQDDDAN